MASIAVEPLSPVLGARITGVDLAQPVSEQVFGVIENALHEHGFIVFPGQSLAPEQFVAFSQRWGRPEPHVIDTYHHPADPNILILSNVFKDGQPTGLVDAGTYFHTDYSYLDVPARCTMLHALQIPNGPSGTTFANQTRAYEELPAAMRERIEPLVCRHHYGNRNDLDTGSRTVASLLNDEQKRKVSCVRHRLARPHPHTGRRSLYAVSGSSFGIEGMDPAQAQALLEELTAHATAERYCHTHQYALGDVIVWDNAQLLHRAPLVDLTQPRTLWRITVKEAPETALAA